MSKCRHNLCLMSWQKALSLEIAVIFMSMTSRVLIADNEFLVNRLLETRLTREGFLVCIARDGQLALSLIRKQQYDVILLDLMVPNVAGQELIMEIQRSTLNSDTPILVLSSLSSDDLIAEVLATGVKEYIVKPYSMNIIVAKTKELAELKLISK